jgi:hypothetical protein
MVLEDSSGQGAARVCFACFELPHACDGGQQQGAPCMHAVHIVWAPHEGDGVFMVA